MIDMLKGLFGGGGEFSLNFGQLLMDAGVWVRLLVLAGPVCLMVLGLLYLFASPREANHRFGYRCYFGMGSVEAWQFTQRLAGIVWTALGAALLVVMVARCWNFGSLGGYDMAVSAAWSLVWELALVLISRLGIHIAVAACFDKEGTRRART